MWICWHNRIWDFLWKLRPQVSACYHQCCKLLLLCCISAATFLFVDFLFLGKRKPFYFVISLMLRNSLCVWTWPKLQNHTRFKFLVSFFSIITPCIYLSIILHTNNNMLYWYWHRNLVTLQRHFSSFFLRNETFANRKSKFICALCLTFDESSKWRSFSIFLLSSSFAVALQFIVFLYIYSLISVLCLMDTVHINTVVYVFL